uniref:Very long-chain specific acyl-CoA dehydrogenase, mitochondrial n=1 Tax=Geospiza parvula TaxID=87175 RepID=A0A8U8B0E2_GEOPR
MIFWGFLVIFWGFSDEFLGFSPLPQAVLPKSGTATATESKSFAVGMFLGRLNSEQVFPYPSVLTEEQEQTLQELVGPLSRFFEEVNNPAKNDALEKVEDKTMKGLKELGAFGLQVPLEFGGLGLNNTQVRPPPNWRTTPRWGSPGPHQSIRPKGLLPGAGSGHSQIPKFPQNSRFSGEWVAAFCLTEPGSGSDAASIRTRATPSPCGTFWTLEGEKIWISNGAWPKLFTVFAKTRDLGEFGEVFGEWGKSLQFWDFWDEFLEFWGNLGEFGSISIKIWGFFDGKSSEFLTGMSQIFWERPKFLFFPKFAFSPKSSRIWGWRRFWAEFGWILGGFEAEIWRFCWKNPGILTGISQIFWGPSQMFWECPKFPFFPPKFQSMAFMISANMDRGDPDFQIGGHQQNLRLREEILGEFPQILGNFRGFGAAWAVADECIQVMGGMGFMQEPGVERVLRDLRIFRIFEGTNDILRLFVALQGFQVPLKLVWTGLYWEGLVYIGLDWKAGLGSGLSLQHLVHPELKDGAQQVRPDPKTHTKFTPKTPKSDFWASRSLSLGLPTAQHERLLSLTWCHEVNPGIGNFGANSGISGKNREF